MITDLDKQFDDALPDKPDGEYQVIIVGHDSFEGKKTKNAGQQFHKLAMKIVGPHTIGAIVQTFLSLPNPNDPVDKRSEQMDRFKETIQKLKIKGFKPSEANTHFLNTVGCLVNITLNTPEGKDQFVNINSIELDENGEPIRRTVSAESGDTPF